MEMILCLLIMTGGGDAYNCDWTLYVHDREIYPYVRYAAGLPETVVGWADFKKSEIHVSASSVDHVGRFGLSTLEHEIAHATLWEQFWTAPLFVEQQYDRFDIPYKISYKPWAFHG